MDPIITNTIEDVAYIIEDVTASTFEELSKIYRSKSNNRLVFPNYSVKEPKKRVSEQELRFVFIELLIPKLKEHHLFYSIETPTLAKYKFSDMGNKGFSPTCYPIDSREGQSASFDLVILQKNEDSKDSRIALIEFKSKNAIQHEHEKDFCKLMNPDEGEGVLRYFIELLESSDSRTINNIKQKIDNYKFPVTAANKTCCPIKIACYSLDKGHQGATGTWINLASKMRQVSPCFYEKR